MEANPETYAARLQTDSTMDCIFELAQCVLEVIHLESLPSLNLCGVPSATSDSKSKNSN